MPAAQAALTKMRKLLSAAAQEEKLAAAANTAAGSGSDSESDTESAGASAVKSQSELAREISRKRAEHFLDWYTAMEDMSRCNEPTALLILDLSPHPKTAFEPIFMAVLDKYADALPVRLQTADDVENYLGKTSMAFMSSHLAYPCRTETALS